MEKKTETYLSEMLVKMNNKIARGEPVIELQENFENKLNMLYEMKLITFDQYEQWAACLTNELYQCIEYLHLNARAENALKMAGIPTVGKLRAVLIGVDSKISFWKIRSVGEGTANNIISTALKVGIVKKDDLGKCSIIQTEVKKWKHYCEDHL